MAEMLVCAINFQKKICHILLTIAFLTHPSICISSYLVQLTNGNRFIIYEYWEDGSQIRFYSYGGVVGIREGLISEITESDLVYKEEIAAKTPDKEARAKKSEGKHIHIDIEYYEKTKKELMEKYRKAKRKLDKATIDRNKAAKRGTRKEIKDLHEQISALSSELKEKNKGVLPDWW